MVEVSFNNTTTLGLVDSGASISVLGETFVQQLQIGHRVQPSNLSSIVGVGGSKHNVRGRVNLTFHIEGVPFQQEFHILSHTNQDVLLGIDFLNSNSAVIDLQGKVLSFPDKQLTVNVLSRGETTVKCTNQITIPPKCIHTVPINFASAIPGRTVLIEPTSPLTELNLMGARCVSTQNKGRSYIQVVNPTTKPINIPQNQSIGLASSVNRRNVLSLKETKSFRKLQIPKKPINFDMSNSDLTVEQKKQLMTLLNNFRDVFAADSSELGRTDVYKHDIELVDGAPPVRSRPYRTSPAMQKVIDKQIEQMLKDRIIEPSNSEFSSPVVLAKKKNNEYRFCVDYRRLNAVTKVMSHPVPLFTDVVDLIGNEQASYFSVLDAASGFWQIPLTDRAKKLSAFVTQSGQYSWTVTPFGLVNSPASFSLVMSSVLRGLNYRVALCYVDDVIIFSKTFEDHLRHLNDVFTRLRTANLTLKPSKCTFAAPEVYYLGHIISKHGVKVQPSKIEAVRSFPVPKNQHDLKSFLGLTCYYRRFIKGYSTIAATLHKLLQKDCKYVWTKETQSAFDLLKQALTSAPVLAYPHSDYPLTIHTDASGQSIGYVLSQTDPQGVSRVLAYGGRALRPNERKWTVTEQECLAVVCAINEYKIYLTNQKVTIVTDNKALTWLKTIKHTNGRLARWSILLSSIDYDIKHRPGKTHQNADSLSRRDYPPPPKQPSVLDEELVQLTNYSVPPMTNPDTNMQESINSPNSTFQPLAISPAQPPVYTINEEQCVKQEWLQTEFFYERDTCQVNAIRPCEIDKTQNIGQLQKECPKIGDLYRYLETGELPLDKKRAHVIPYESNQFALLNGTLYHFFQPRARKPKSDLGLLRQIVVPEVLQHDVLLSYHDSVAGGAHFGIQRVYQAIKQKYYWPGQYKDVYNHIVSCDKCQNAKRDTHSQKAPLHPIPSDGLFERWHLDFLEMEKSDSSSFRYVLLVSDSFSNWTEAFCMRTQQSEEVAKILYNEIFTRYGAPKILVSDRGMSFMAKLVAEICKIFQVTRHVTSSYHARSNSVCERKNSTLAQCLRTYCDKDPKKWPELIPSIMMAFRMSPCTQASGYSPYYLLFGREMPIFFDTAVAPSEALPRSHKQHVEELLQRLKVAHKIAKSNIDQTKEQNKERYDKNAKEPSYNVEDRVLLKVMHRIQGVSKKLTPKWTGPYYITRLGPNSTFKLRRCSDNVELKPLVHADRLKRFVDSRDFRPPPINEPNERPDQITPNPDLEIEVDQQPDQEIEPPANIPSGTNDNTIRNKRNVTTPSEDRHLIHDSQIPGPSTSDSQTDLHTDNSVPDAALSDQPNPSQPQTQNKDRSADDGWYEALRLLKHKRISGKIHYLVEWADGSKPTWEPVSFVTPALIQNYHVRLTQKRAAPKRR